MKKIFIAVLLVVAVNSYGQIPDGYYATTAGLTGLQLKDALYNIIKGQTEYPYTSSSTDTWDILKEADQDPNNSENVILIYSGESVDAEQEYNSGSGWTREHVWAKSRGDFGTDKGPGTDCHHLKACCTSLNSTRSNRAFGEGGSEVWYHNYFTGCYKGTEYTFEPRDAVKGDVARAILYMATRYEGENGEPDLKLTEEVFSNTDKQPVHGIKSVLLRWNEEDPVDDFERHHNDVVYSYQHNRNPFVDHPEFVAQIWGNATAVNTITDNADYTFSINASGIHLMSDNPFSKVDVYNITGQKVTTHQEANVSETDININGHGLFILVIDDNQTLKISM
nr:endonuclease [uncultured Carboxylicivirga sp.]